MRCVGIPTVGVALFLSVFAFAPAHAQATRTWVSGLGDDANPCSRTAPCKTFAGTIGKTAAAGEINCLDSAGYGSVTITKSIRISCEDVTAGIIGFANVDGIVVNAGSADVVQLSGLDINGLGIGRHGINFIAGGRLLVERTTIRNYNSAGSFGIQFAPFDTARLEIDDSSFINNGSSTDGGGVRIAPSGVIVTRAFIANSLFDQNRIGISVIGNGSTTSAQIFRSRITHSTSTGAAATGGLSEIRIGSSEIVDNLGPATVGTVFSFGNNRIVGNNPDTSPTLTSLR